MPNDPKTGTPASSLQDDRREYLLRPTGKPGEISGVPRKPTLDEVKRLEAIAYDSGNGVDLGVFQTALMRYYYPEYTEINGLDRYVFSTFEREYKNPAFTLTSVAFNANTNSIGTINLDNATRLITDLYDPKNRADPQNPASRFSPEYFDHTHDGTSGSTDSFYISGPPGRTYSRVLIHNELTKALRQGTVEDYAHSMYNKRVLSLNSAEHEVGHLIQRLDGTSIKMEEDEKNSKNSNLRWIVHCEENFADTYAALRQISVKGSEGINRLRRLINYFNFLFPQDAEHYTLNSTLNVYDYAQEHLEEIKAASPRELYDLAKKLAAPLPKDEFSVLSTMSLTQIYESAYQPTNRDRPSDDPLRNKAVDHLINITARANLIPDYYPKELRQFLDHFSSEGKQENPYNPNDPVMRAEAKRYLDGFEHIGDYLPDKVDYKQSKQIENQAINGFIARNPSEARELGLNQHDRQAGNQPILFKNEFIQTAVNLRMLAIHGKDYENVIQQEIIQESQNRLESGENGEKDGSIRGLRRALDIAAKHPEIFSGLSRDECYDLALRSIKEDPKLQSAAYSGQFIIPLDSLIPGGVSYAIKDLNEPPAPQKVGFLEHDGIDPTIFIYADSYLRNIAQAGHKGVAFAENAVRSLENDPSKKAQMIGAQIALEIANKNPQALSGLGEQECHHLLFNTLQTDKRLKSMATMATIENNDITWWDGENSGTASPILLPQNVRTNDSLLDGKMVPISRGTPPPTGE